MTASIRLRRTRIPVVAVVCETAQGQATLTAPCVNWLLCLVSSQVRRLETMERAVADHQTPDHVWYRRAAPLPESRLRHLVVRMAVLLRHKSRYASPHSGTSQAQSV